MKLFLVITLAVASLFAVNIQLPVAKFISSGAVTDLLIHENKLYSATDASCIDVFDMKSRKTITKIEVDKITDFMGDLVDSKVYSVDAIEDKILILSQTKQGFRRVHIYKDNRYELIISYQDNLSIAKAKFLDSNTILLALLSNELISYDIKKRKQNWLLQVSGAKFSDFALSENKKHVVIADESGDLKIHNTKSGKLEKLLEGQNLDNVFQVDYKNGIIATAGQDRRVVVYNTKLHSAYYKSAPFLIYSVGLSPSGKLVAYSSDENNNVTVFKTKTKSTVGVYGGNKMTITNILFTNEKEFLISSDDNTINLYKIK